MDPEPAEGGTRLLALTLAPSLDLLSDEDSYDALVLVRRNA